jgi:hypothetical protein
VHSVQDKLAATVLAAMVLFPVMNMIMLPELLGYTPETCFSHDHSCLLAPSYRLVIWTNDSTELQVEYYLYNTTRWPYPSSILRSMFRLRLNGI